MDVELQIDDADSAWIGGWRRSEDEGEAWQSREDIFALERGFLFLWVGPEIVREEDIFHGLNFGP